MRFQIIWPERRLVDEDQIRVWFDDAVANGDLPEEYAQNITEPEEMARELSDIGHITLGRGRA